MKVLVTGGNGQLATELMRYAPAGVDALALGHRDLDIGDEGAVIAAMRAHVPDVVINTAAYTAVDKAESEQQAALRANAEGARNLAMALQGSNSRLIHISTDFVFDGMASTPYCPDAATAPLGVYGVTKLAGEQAVALLLPVQSVVVRTSWLYSSRGGNFMRTMLRLMRERKVVRVIADQVGSPTSAGSLSRALWTICAKPEIQGIHHWSDSGVASWYDFAVAIHEEAALLGLLPIDVSVTPISTQDYPTPARRPSYSVLDKSSLITALGFAPAHWRHNLRQVLAEIRGG